VGGDRRQLLDRTDRYWVMEVTPRRREERRTEGGDRRRGDEKEKRQLRKEQGKPVIVYAEPRRGKTYHCPGLAFH